MKKINFILFFAATFFGCNQEKKEQNHSKEGSLFPVAVTIKELSDADYPDNPDITIRSILDGQYSHKKLVIAKADGHYSFIITPNNDLSDTIIITDVAMMEFIPYCPLHVKDDYMKYLGVVNQEWNRQQVKYYENQISIYGNGKEGEILKRIDIARNCLNAYLWEIIAYTEEEGQLKPYYHGWFDFPEKQYAALFEQHNGVPYEKYQKPLEDWVHPENKPLDLGQLRKVIDTSKPVFFNKNDEYFILSGERKKKSVNIIKPKASTSINDFLNDSTLFATFTPPGFYNTSDPRKTKLGRLNNPVDVLLSKTSSPVQKDTSTFELKIFFNDTIKNRQTHLIVGGLEKDKIPCLKVEEVNRGFQMPMGIANHSFYETAVFMKQTPSEQNPYYGLLTDGNGNWLDSHDIGIDGPLLHFDADNPNLLHLWVLSFERHAFVGHYVINVSSVL